MTYKQQHNEHMVHQWQKHALLLKNTFLFGNKNQSLPSMEALMKKWNWKAKQKKTKIQGRYVGPGVKNSSSVSFPLSHWQVTPQRKFLLLFRKHHVLTYLVSCVFNFSLPTHEITRIHLSIHVIRFVPSTRLTACF